LNRRLCLKTRHRNDQAEQHGDRNAGRKLRDPGFTQGFIRNSAALCASSAVMFSRLIQGFRAIPTETNRHRKKIVPSCRRGAR